MKKRFLQILSIIIIIILFYLLFQFANSFFKTQQIKKILNEATTINIYKLSSKNVERFTEEQLSKEISFTIKNPKEYFKKIHYKKTVVLWKGDLYGRIYLENNKIIELRWSPYGNFFALKNEKGHYSFSIE
ncbi:hypothetical protein [Wukongibacter sp. M2B1]|uniref:hypothetical protein n=1 Tax=Wukongibacter sp. M2B1 TaxID=3088895 RepID=UPI003D7B9812